MSKYIVHKAVELKKVVKGRGLTEQDLQTKFLAQPKHDGCNAVVIWRGAGSAHPCGDCEIFSRTGEAVGSLDHIKSYLAFMSAQPGVYLGEAWAVNTPFPEISGLFRRKASNADTVPLGIVYFDFLTLQEWNFGYSDVPYVQRVERLSDTMTHQSVVIGSPFKPIRGFGVLADHWPDLTPGTLANQLKEAGGYDGAIFRDPDGLWSKGNLGTNGEIIKVKPRISVSIRVTSYEGGKGKHVGKIGCLRGIVNGKEQGLGTGLKDSERFTSNFERDWLGKIVEVEALGYTEDGLLREPVMLGVRDDVLEVDA